VAILRLRSVADVSSECEWSEAADRDAMVVYFRREAFDGLTADLGRMRPVGLGQPSDGGPVLFLLMPGPSSLAPNT